MHTADTTARQDRCRSTPPSRERDIAHGSLAGVAIPWFVLETTNSAARFGITGVFGMLPVILAAFSGGVVVDRFDFKRSIIVADNASTAVALIPLLHLTTGLAFWQVMGPLGLLATGYLLEIIHIQLALAGIAVWFLAGIVALAAAKVDFGVAAPS